VAMPLSHRTVETRAGNSSSSIRCCTLRGCRGRWLKPSQQVAAGDSRSYAAAAMVHSQIRCLRKFSQNLDAMSASKCLVNPERFGSSWWHQEAALNLWEHLTGSPAAAGAAGHSSYLMSRSCNADQAMVHRDNKKGVRNRSNNRSTQPWERPVIKSQTTNHQTASPRRVALFLPQPSHARAQHPSHSVSKHP
jgi:hypothetical protein